MRVNTRIKQSVKRELDHMSRLNGPAGVKVGLPKGSNDYPITGESVINVGFWQEFGTRRMAPHPWMRPTIRENRARYAKLLKQGLKALQQKKASSDRILGRLGSTAKNHLVAKIDKLPLVDTGHLKQSQAWEIVKQ